MSVAHVSSSLLSLVCAVAVVIGTLAERLKNRGMLSKCCLHSNDSAKCVCVALAFASERRRRAANFMCVLLVVARGNGLDYVIVAEGIQSYYGG